MISLCQEGDGGPPWKPRAASSGRRVSDRDRRQPDCFSIVVPALGRTRTWYMDVKGSRRARVKSGADRRDAPDREEFRVSRNSLRLSSTISIPHWKQSVKAGTSAPFSAALTGCFQCKTLLRRRRRERSRRSSSTDMTCSSVQSHRFSSRAATVPHCPEYLSSNVRL